MLAAILILLILAVSFAGLAWHVKHYCIVDFKVYPRNAAVLDLRQEEISFAHYQRLSRKLPQCEIKWNIPFQGNTYSQETQILRLTEASRHDRDVLQCFPRLKTVDARGCTDYETLTRLKEELEGVEILYTVVIGGREYDQDADTVIADGITEEETALLAYLPEWKKIQIETASNARQLMNVCRERDIAVYVKLGSRYYEGTTQYLTIPNIAEEELVMLQYLPELKGVSLPEPNVPAQQLLSLTEERPEVDFTWSKEVLGTRFSRETEQMDLTERLSKEGAVAYAYGATAPILGERDEETWLFALKEKYPLPDKRAETAALIAEVEAALEYFPDLRKVLLCGCFLDNEAMAQFRERHREDYQVVWTVQCGKVAARTDTPYFMPTKFHVYYFRDADAENLRYCEDIICVDLGHMAIQKIDWVAYMPNLQYLILAHTDVRSIEPIRSCKNLKFLELDWSGVQDYTPLKDCTALEDLNLGNTNRDFAPIAEMTWLKNLWMVGCGGGNAYTLSQTLTETKVVASGSATVAGGWRSLPNYYAMRDIMNMFYMRW